MLQFDKDLISFINENIDKDPGVVLLKYGGKVNFDIKIAAATIHGIKKIAEKIPEWRFNTNLIYPSKLSVEQCSSSLTAMLKCRYYKNIDTVIDISGGLGVDAYYASKVVKSVYLFEKNTTLASAAHHNFKELQRSNIIVVNQEISSKNISRILDDILQNNNDPKRTALYIDPSRRDSAGGRLFALEQYQPNILDFLDIIIPRVASIIIKVSPMADISYTIKQLRRCSAVNIISIHNECKELLFIIENTNPEYNIDTVPYEAWNYNHNNRWEHLTWLNTDERDIKPDYILPKRGLYLYEPNCSIIKGGGFKSVTNIFNVIKLSPNTHLYLSDLLIDDFHGRRFQIIDIYSYNKADIDLIKKNYPKAALAVRNFPVSAEDLRKKMRLKESDSLFIFGVTLIDNSKKLIVCKKC